MADVKKILGQQTECIQSTDKAFLDVATGIAEVSTIVTQIAEQSKSLKKIAGELEEKISVFKL